MLTFEALSETSEFAKKWVPFCKRFNIEPRAPEFYFQQKIDYLKDKVQPSFVKERRAMKVITCNNSSTFVVNLFPFILSSLSDRLIIVNNFIARLRGIQGPYQCFGCKSPESSRRRVDNARWNLMAWE